MIKFFINFIFTIFILQTDAQVSCVCSEWNEKEKTKNEPLLLINSSNSFCRARGFELIATEFSNKNELDSVAYFLEKAALSYKTAACEVKHLLGVYKLWAKYYFTKADYSPSLDYSLKILAISEQSNNYIEQANVILNISQIFNRMGQIAKGIEYSRKAIPLAEKISDSPEKVDIINKIGARYYYSFQDYKNKVYMDTAKMFYNQAIAIAKSINYRKGKMSSYNKMNTLSYREKNYKQALLYIDSAMALANRNTDDGEVSVSYGDKGNILLKIGDLQNAKKFADSGLFYSLKAKFPPTIANLYSLIAEIADSSRDYKVAYRAIYAEKKITDSLNKTDKIKAVNELEKKYNQAKNEKTIKEFAQQKLIYALLGVAGILIAGLCAFYFRQQSLKNKHRVLETEQRLNRARMNPHFFFNALTAMQHFAMKENDGKALASNLSKFSNIMRETLESTYKEYVTIKQEVDFLKEYLEIQKMRFPNKYTYSLMIDGVMDPADIMIPAMIIQPFIENIIEHGFENIGYTGIIRVEFTQEQKNTIITVTDNGRGLSTPGEKVNEHISRASQIIKDRIYLLNIKLKTNADFSIQNNESDKGVIVRICLPLIYNNENINS